MRGKDVIAVIQYVTKAWTKQRKQEYRQASAKLRRHRALRRRCSITIKSAASAHMANAYMKASSGATLPAQARQIMYAARGPILQATGEDQLDDKYFTQRLLPDFMNENPGETSDWDVVFDARGNLHEPHTRRVLPLGTIHVRDYLKEVEFEAGPNPLSVSGGGLLPTCGPVNRWQGLMFIEKEGFLPLFQKVRLAERYDLAIMSTKGLSVTASRMLVDKICGEHNIPLLVLHDFDKAGFSILGTLSRDTRRYTFENEFKIIDLGLRLEDVEDYGLESEQVRMKSDPAENLRENGATQDEIAFLADGRRVELNAFTSGDFVEWIESKLDNLGLTKLIPNDRVLRDNYHRMLTAELVRESFHELVRQSEADARSRSIPDDLRERVERRLLADRSLSWDDAVAAEVRSIEGAGSNKETPNAT